MINELEFNDYLLLLVLLKSPLLCFAYFKFIHKSNKKKDVESSLRGINSKVSDSSI